MSNRCYEQGRGWTLCCGPLSGSEYEQSVLRLDTIVDGATGVLIPCDVKLACDTYEGFLVFVEGGSSGSGSGSSGSSGSGSGSKRLFQVAPVDGAAVVTDNLSVRAGEGASASAAAAAGAGVGADLLQPAGSDGGKEGSLVPVAGTVRGEWAKAGLKAVSTSFLTQNE